MVMELREAVLCGEYAHGDRLLSERDHPTPQDCRWGAVCKLNLGQTAEAMLLLRQAIQQGCLEANIELASALMGEGRLAEVKEILAPLEEVQLEPMDTALLFRVRALYEAQTGSRAKAREYAERALSYAATAPRAVQASAAQLVGLLAAREGDDVQAAEYLTVAQKRAHRAQDVYVNLALATSLMQLGEFAEARKALEQAALNVPQTPYARAVVQYGFGMLAHIQGRQDVSAAEHFREAIKSAHQANQKETEFYAQLWLSAAVSDQEWTDARVALARAESLVDGELMRAHFKFREAALALRRGQRADPYSLQEALKVFQQQGSRREMCWIWLHIAEASWQDDPLAAGEALGQATTLHAALGGQHNLRHILRQLPQVYAYLHTLPPDTYERRLLEQWQRVEQLETVHIMTLGTQGILYNDIPVHLHLARTPEILAYVLEHPNSSLQAIQTTLFPDTPSQRSKNYFHQVRLDIRRTVKGLEIEYNAAQKSYTVMANGLNISWDILELERDLERPEAELVRAAQMLTAAQSDGGTSEWLTARREDLRLKVLSKGLAQLSDYMAQQAYPKALTLAQALLPLDEFNELMHSSLIQLKLHLNGQESGHCQWLQSRNYFLDQLGDVPQSLLAWTDHFQQWLSPARDSSL